MFEKRVRIDRSEHGANNGSPAESLPEGKILVIDTISQKRLITIKNHGILRKF